MAIAAAALSLFAAEFTRAQTPSDMQPNLLPRRVAGFDFGGDERRARQACERAGHKWTVEWKSSHGGGPRNCVGGTAEPWYSTVVRTDLFFCGANGTKLCDLTLHLRTRKAEVVLRKLKRAFGEPGITRKNRAQITSALWSFLPYKDSHDWPYIVRLEVYGDSSQADADKAGTIQVRFTSPRHDDG